MLSRCWEACASVPGDIGFMMSAAGNLARGAVPKTGHRAISAFRNLMATRYKTLAHPRRLSPPSDKVPAAATFG